MGRCEDVWCEEMKGVNIWRCEDVMRFRCEEAKMWQYENGETSKKKQDATYAFAIFCAQTLLHKDPFTHGPFYTQTLWITHKHFYTQTLLHTDPFTHRSFTQRPFVTQTLLHTGSFTHRPFHTLSGSRRNAFTHRRFFAQTPLHIFHAIHQSSSVPGCYK